jgi:5-methylcytosine-specific restriction protein A
MPRAAPVHKPRGQRDLKDLRRETDRKRPSASKRLYDTAWQKLRKRKLVADPLCQCDDCEAGAKRVTAATVVDHIVPIAERPDLRLDWDNLRSMSKTCHDRHTARTRGFGRAGRGG